MGGGVWLCAGRAAALIDFEGKNMTSQFKNNFYNEFEFDGSDEKDRLSVDRDEQSEGGEDQSETSDESGDDGDSNEVEHNVDVENRDEQSDMSY